MADWRRSHLESCEGLRGDGLEIGACTRPTAANANVKYLDFFTTEELRANVARNGRDDPDKVMPVEYVAAGEDYRAVIDRHFNFIIANHVMEHIIDPIAWLRMLSELLAPNGHLLLTLPDKKYCFDRFRDDTTAAHLIADFLSEATLEEKARPHVIETIMFYDRSYINRTVTPEQLFDAALMAREKHHPGIHCHVFQGETFLDRVLRPILYAKLIDYTLVSFQPKSDFGEFAVVLRKGWTPFEFTVEQFYGRNSSTISTEID